MFCCMGKKMTYRVLSLLLCGIIGAVAISFMLFAPDKAVSAAKYEWGLSFQQPNAPPIPNLSAEKLAPYNSYYCSPKQEKKLYLTFDAGFENSNTAPILQALKKHNAPGAFFLVGPYIKENVELVKQMVNEGHVVGNHTYHHANMTQKDKQSFIKELQDTEAAYKEIIGLDMPKFYRPPEGKFSDENLIWANELGYKTIFWSIAYVDWNRDNQPSHEAAFAKLMPRTHDGAIVLLHSTSRTNAEILDELLTKWEEMGYTFGSLNELGAV